MSCKFLSCAFTLISEMMSLTNLVLKHTTILCCIYLCCIIKFGQSWNELFPERTHSLQLEALLNNIVQHLLKSMWISHKLNRISQLWTLPMQLSPLCWGSKTSYSLTTLKSWRWQQTNKESIGVYFKRFC